MSEEKIIYRKDGYIGNAVRIVRYVNGVATVAYKGYENFAFGEIVLYPMKILVNTGHPVGKTTIKMKDVVTD